MKTKTTRKLLALLLTLAVLLSVTPITVLAEETTNSEKLPQEVTLQNSTETQPEEQTAVEDPGVKSVEPNMATPPMTGAQNVIEYPGNSTYASLPAAISAAEANGASVKLTADVVENTNDVFLTVSGTVTLDLNGYIIQGNRNGKLIVVKDGASLTLEDNGSSDTIHYFLVEESYSWELISDPSDDVKNNATPFASLTEAPESGTYVSVTGGFIYGGGKDNGGGVEVGSSQNGTGGTFILKSGSIVGCYSPAYGGGVYNWTKSTFNMEGGAILGCYCHSGGGAGVLNHGTFTMKNDAAIIGNKANEGGGILNWYDGNCEISGGTVSCNKAKTYGGGIFNHNEDNKRATLTISNAAITNNTAATAGGILNNGTATLNSGTVISNNKALSNEDNFGKGGGIQNNSTLNVIGATITNNIATKQGGGVDANVGTFTVGGETKITGNTAGTGANVYLVNNQTVCVDETSDTTRLRGGASIGVHRADGKGGPITSIADRYAKYFFSDPGKTAVNNDNNGYVEFVDSNTLVGIMFENEYGGVFTESKVNANNSIWTVSDNQWILQKDFTGYNIIVSKGQKLNIDLKGYAIKGAGNTNTNRADIFTVESGSELVLSSSANMSYIGSHHGSGIVVNSGATCTISNINIDSCKLESSANGGGIRLSGAGAKATLTNCSITNCTAYNGGAIYVSDGGTISLNGGKIQSNEANNIGGAVAVDGAGTVELTGVKFDDSTYADQKSKNNAGNQTEGGYIIHAVGNEYTDQPLVTVKMVNCTLYRVASFIDTGLGSLVFKRATFIADHCNLYTNSIAASCVYIENSGFRMIGGKIWSKCESDNKEQWAVVSKGTSKIDLSGAAALGSYQNGGGLLLYDNYTLTSALKPETKDNETVNPSINFRLYKGTGLVGTGFGAQYFTNTWGNPVYTYKNSIYTGYPVKIGNTNYGSLQAALNAANGSAITLLADLSENVTLATGKTAKLNLNGKTLAAVTSDPTITNAGTLTIEDNSAGGTGTVEAYTINDVALKGVDTTTGDTVSGSALTVNSARIYGKVTKDDKSGIEICGGLYTEDYAQYTKSAAAIQDLGAEVVPYRYKAVPEEDFVVVGYIYDADNPIGHAYSTIQEAIDECAGNSLESPGVISVCKDISENIEIKQNKYIYLLLEKHTLTASESDKPVISNKGGLVVGEGTITGSSVGIEHDGDWLTIGGEMEVSGTKGIYLKSGKKLNISNVSSNNKIGLYVDVPAEGNSVILSDNNTKDFSRYFYSQNSEWSVLCGESNTLVLVKNMALFKGSSLRRRVSSDDATKVVNTSTDIRFEFTFAMPEGATIDTDNSKFVWTTGTSDLTSGKEVKMEKYELVSGTSNTYKANLVLTGVPAANFDTEIYAQLHVAYTDSQSKPGSLESAISNRSVNKVINGLISYYKDIDTNNTWYRYAKYLNKETDTYTK